MTTNPQLSNKNILLLYKVCRRLAHKYTFGYYDIDDITQEAFIIGMKLIHKYNRKRGMSLESFLYMSINNRLKDFKRDNYVRILKKCNCCEDIDAICEYCQRKNWQMETRKNLMEPIDIDNVCHDNESNISTKDHFIDDVEINELKTIIDKELPIDMRADYIRMLNSISITKQRRELIEFTILQILLKHGYTLE